MGPIDAIKTCLIKSFQFSGRASRSEFWWFAVFVGAVAAVLLYPHTSFFSSVTSDVLVTKTSAFTGETTQSLERQTAWYLYRIDWSAISLTIAGCFYLLLSAATSRRLHDVGAKAYFGLAMLVLGPLSSVLTVVIFYALSKVSFGLAVSITTILGLISWILWIVCPIVLVILLMRPSEDGATEFGPNPHEVPS